MANTFFWYDLMTPDTQAAAKFYCDVIGWTTQDVSQSGHTYAIFQRDGGVNAAGLMPVPQEMGGNAQPAWFGYVAVDDVDGMAKRIQGEGGTLQRGPIEVPGVIRFAVVSDPVGAVFLIAKGLNPSPMPEVPAGTPGTIGWHELYSRDWKAAWRFYEKLFGWTKDRAIDMGEMGTYQLFAAGGNAIGGMMNVPPEAAATFWGYYVNVDAIDSAIERVKKSGGKVTMGPHQVPGGSWILQATDPQGAHFALVAPKR